MPLKNVRYDKALRLAKRFHPVFKQEFESPFDLIGEFNPGDFEVPKEPVLYFAVKEGVEHFFIYYLVYHYADWSNWIKPLRVLDEHRHDMEGVVIAVRRNRSDKREIDWVCSRAHTMLIFNEHSHAPIKGNTAWFRIESGGHGIHPGRGIPDKNEIIYRKCKLINIDKVAVAREIQHTWIPEFAKSGVTMPWAWFDGHIKQRYCRKIPGMTVGMIWTDPQQLYELAKKIGRA